MPALELESARGTHLPPLAETTAAQRWPKGPGGAGLLSLPLLLFFVIPVLALLLRTPGANVLASLEQPEAWQAIELSLRTTTLSAALTVMLGTPLAYLLARR